MKKLMILIAMVAIAGAASADLYTLISAPNNTANWNLGTLTWSNVTTGVVGTHAASAGNNYVVDSALVTAGKIRAASSTFAGDSITFRGSVNKFTMAPSTNSANIILDGGSMLLAGTPVALEGTLTGSGGIGLVRRDLKVDSLLSGSGTIEVNNANTTVTAHSLFTLGGSSSTFTGLLIVGGTGTDADSRRVTMDMNYDNSVAFDMDLVESGGVNAVLNIDQDIKLNSLTMGATELAEGTYTYAQLVTAGHGAYFTDGGGGSVQVVPEPATVGMLGLGALVAMFIRRVRS